LTEKPVLGGQVQLWTGQSVNFTFQHGRVSTKHPQEMPGTTHSTPLVNEWLSGS
jgi:hypothetical protein